MTQTETTWDKLLQIKTTGRDDSHADRFHHPYEPTPYSVLERLANKGFIGKRDVVLDYGCGIPGGTGDRTGDSRKKCEEKGVNPFLMNNNRTLFHDDAEHRLGQGLFMHFSCIF